jgi:hypothetical protein
LSSLCCVAARARSADDASGASPCAVRCALTRHSTAAAAAGRMLASVGVTSAAPQPDAAGSASAAAVPIAPAPASIAICAATMAATILGTIEPHLPQSVEGDGD